MANKEIHVRAYDNTDGQIKNFGEIAVCRNMYEVLSVMKNYKAENPSLVDFYCKLDVYENGKFLIGGASVGISEVEKIIRSEDNITAVFK
jgi:hypothetical protein